MPPKKNQIQVSLCFSRQFKWLSNSFLFGGDYCYISSLKKQIFPSLRARPLGPRAKPLVAIADDFFGAQLTQLLRPVEILAGRIRAERPWKMGRPWKSPGKNMEKWDNQHNPTYTMKKYEKYIGIEKNIWRYIYIYNAYWNHILGYSRIMGYISNNNQRYEGIWACEPLEFGVPSNAQVVHVFFRGRYHRHKVNQC